MPGAQIAFIETETISHGAHRSSAERDAVLRVVADDALDYDGWQERWVLPLMNLIEFATREASRVERFTAITRDETIEVPPLFRGVAFKETFQRHDVEFVRPQASLRYEGPRHGYRRQLLSVGALGDDLERFVARWFELTHELGAASGFLFSTLSSRLYVTTQPVVLGSVAEAYHRALRGGAPIEPELHDALVKRMLETLDDDNQRKHYGRALHYANGRSQDERIRALLVCAGEAVPSLGRKSGRLSRLIVDTRNDLVHLPSDGREILEGVDLVEAVNLLVLALHANLLIDLGIGREHAATLLERSYGEELLWQRLIRRGAAWPKGRGRSTE